MRTLGDLINAVQKLDIDYLISNSLLESREDYVRLQQEQMLKGEREDGSPIFNLKTGSDQYSPGYAKRKGKSSPIDLRDTGAFQGGIFFKIDDAQSFTVDSDDSKSGMLQENYGKQIFGLNDESNVQFIQVFKQNLSTDLINDLSK